MKIDERKIEAQREHYGKLASDFDLKFKRENPNHIYKIQEISRVISEHFESTSHPLDILELGGGTGIHASHFLALNGRKIGSFFFSDASEEMLKQAEKRLSDYSNVEYVVSPAEDFTTEVMFDCIYVSGSMHHFANPIKSVAVMKNHLKLNGLIVVCEPIVWNPVNFVKAAISREEWGQFKVTRKNVRCYMETQGGHIVEDKVLHWKGSTNTAENLWPYQKLEKCSALNDLAVMFLIAARFN